MPIIKILPSDLSDQIAAGEVVERPSSVAKELLENALDAKASRILIDFAHGGVTRLRIVDNGTGMTPEDARLSIQRHATSKITSLSDLQQIGTLGFRGEALASIASVSKFRLRTKCDGDLAATLVSVVGGGDISVAEIGGPVGTEIIVEDLFFNIPARRKFLKKPETESSHIVETVQRLAICYPLVAFKVIRDGKSVMDVPSHKTLSERLEHLFPKSITDQLRILNVPGSFGLEGVVGKPEDARGSTRHYYLFINGRIVKDRVLMSAVQSGCGHRLTKGKHPFAVIKLNLPAQAVDVNVHPAKTEVRFADSRQIYRMVARTVEGALSRENGTSTLLGSMDTSDRLSGLAVKTLVEADLTSVTAPPKRNADKTGLAAQKRRVFDAMARLAKKTHSQGGFKNAPRGAPDAPIPIQHQSNGLRSEATSSTPPRQAALDLNSRSSIQNVRHREVSDSPGGTNGFDLPPKSTEPQHRDPQDMRQEKCAQVGGQLSIESLGIESEIGAEHLLASSPVLKHAGLVVFKMADGLLVFDSGRLNAEIYRDRIAAKRFEALTAETPVAVELSGRMKLDKVRTLLEKYGVESEPFGVSTLRLTSFDSTVFDPELTSVFKAFMERADWDEKALALALMQQAFAVGQNCWRSAVGRVSKPTQLAESLSKMGRRVD